MSPEKTTLDDYLARLNLEGDMDVWDNNRIKLDFVFKKISKYLKPNLTACDIGIGDGYTLIHLYNMGLKVTGIDVAQFSVDFLGKKFKEQGMNIELKHDDISQTELPENGFDLVTCFDVLEHTPIDGLQRSINNIEKALKDGGFLIGTLPLGEDLDENKAICPKCGHEFHRYGHFHSFASVKDIQTTLGSSFKIVRLGEVPYTWFESNFLNKIVSFALKFVKRIAHRKFDTTVYFIARLSKPE